MKDLKLINTIALLIPIIISCFALFEKDILIIAIVSLSVTGFLQIATSLIFLFRKPKNYFNIIYIILVILFFISLFMFAFVVQLHGAGGFCDDFPLAFLYAQSRALSMADGPDEVRRRTCTLAPLHSP